MINTQLNSTKMNLLENTNSIVQQIKLKEDKHRFLNEKNIDQPGYNISIDNIKEEVEESKETLEESNYNLIKNSSDINIFDQAINDLIGQIHYQSICLPIELFESRAHYCIQAINELIISKRKEKYERYGENKNRNSEQFLLKIEKDSSSNSVIQNTPRNSTSFEKLSKNSSPVCCMFIDPYGCIKNCCNNSKEVFGRADLIGFNFFEDLMAGYNRSYFLSKFGPFPFLNMKKPNTVLRYSLDHQDDDPSPVIVTSKVTIIYSDPQPGLPRSIKGAKVISRLSSEESSLKFKDKLSKGTAKAGQIAIQHLKYQMFLKQNVKSIMRDFNKVPENLDQTNPEICPFDSACNFS